MGYVFITPEWFFAYSIVLEIFFAVITFIVSFYAFKVYKLSEEKQSKLLGFAFLSISFSYILQSILNFLVLYQFDDDISHAIQLQNVYLLNLLGSYAHALLFIIGLVILAYLTLKINNDRVLALLLAICVVSVYFHPLKVFMFYVLSSVLLLFTVIYYFMNYINNRKINTLMVLIAMIFLLFGTLHLMFAVDNALYYVIGHILELIAYALMLINLLIILKHGKKKG